MLLCSPPPQNSFYIYKEMLNSLRKVYLQNQDGQNKTVTVLMVYLQIFIAFVIAFSVLLNVS